MHVNNINMTMIEFFFFLFILLSTISTQQGIPLADVAF
jgi:hypothetical protein